GDEEFLERLANAAFLRCVRTDGEDGRVEILAGEFSKLHVSLARRVARYALETANPSRAYGLEEVDALCRAVTGSTRPNLPGLTVERFGPNAVLLNKGRHEPRPAVDPLELRLDVPGMVEAPNGVWSVTAEGPMVSTGSATSLNGQVVVDAAGIGSHLIVRYRRPGDRLHPLGAPGRKKVQDVLVDRKVPRDDRDTLPIVTTSEGDIVWVAGQVLAEGFRVTPLTTSVVVLTLGRRAPGGRV
ncbi:MAG: tRNA lysidine(34) synthetase TilS, partial [Vicinamibacterales bacterium]